MGERFFFFYFIFCYSQPPTAADAAGAIAWRVRPEGAPRGESAQIPRGATRKRYQSAILEHNSTSIFLVKSFQTKIAVIRIEIKVEENQ